MSAAATFRRLAGRAGRVVRRVSGGGTGGDPALDAVRRHVERRRGGFFVQIGSNDGVTGDPIHEHVVANKWGGVVVEPLPDVYARLCETYRDLPAIRTVNAAIGPERGVLILHRVMDSRPGDPPWANQLASFDRDVVMKHEPVVPSLAERVVEVEVPSLTWVDLVRDAGSPVIDLVHVDTEGYDLEVLRQIDWASPGSPRAVLYEHRHLSDEDKRAAVALLEAAGYRTVRGASDTFAVAGPGGGD